MSTVGVSKSRKQQHQLGNIHIKQNRSRIHFSQTAVSNQARSEYDIENDKTLGYFAFTSMCVSPPTPHFSTTKT